MESTVKKKNVKEKKINIFRLEAVFPDDIKRVFDSDPNYNNYKINCITEKIKISKEELLKMKKKRKRMIILSLWTKRLLDNF